MVSPTAMHELARRALQALTLLWLLAALLAAAPGPARAETIVALATAARVGGDGERSRFVADLSVPVSFTAYVLPDPYRVVIDLPRVRFDLQAEAGSQARGLVSEFRWGEVENGRSRIVIDVTAPILIEKSFVVAPQADQPGRLVVDLVRTTPESFLEAFQAGPSGSGGKGGEAQTVVFAETAFEPAPPAEEEPPAPATKAQAPSHGDGKPVIVIDPGHGGADPGAIGLKKTREKDVVLAFGLSLRDALRKSGAYEVHMTRSDDRFLSLAQRVRSARQHKASLFIAIHADKVRGPSARGATIYTLSEKASDAEAEALAHKENRSDIIGGIDLAEENEAVTDILIDLVQRESKNHALFFARKAVGEMQAVTKFTGKPLRSAGFVVLKAPDVPSVLVELGYLSSKDDESQLTSPQWRARVAASMARAIDGYFALQVAARTR